MTLEELWHLFPISLHNHNNDWTDWYKEEKNNISVLINGMDYTFYHIGSTSIPNIKAKNIVDILISFNKTTDMEKCANILSSNGYIVMSKETNRISLNKGYTEQGFADKVFHIHLRLNDDIDEVYFRDYLISNPDVAEEYEKLKISLSDKFKYDRDGYTDAKSGFIKKYTELAKIKEKNLYEGQCY